MIVVVAWLAWDYLEHGQLRIANHASFERVFPLGRNQRDGANDATQRSEEDHVAHLSQSLQRVTERLARPLDDGPADQRAELANLRRMIEREQQQGHLTPDQARLARRVAGRLQHLNTLRVQQAQAYATTISQPIRTLGTQDEARERRAAQLKQLKHNWEETLKEHTPIIDREIRQLPRS